MSQPIVVRAPAKINLGLEILGKREDGYHEIRSILAMIDLYDDLRFQSGGPENRTVSIAGVSAEQNLIDRAIHLVRSTIATDVGVDYRLTKRIPIAAGLGGASSDAAATLIAVNRLLGRPLSQDQLVELAATLGSDVPFFLGDPVAFVAGTGTTITPLPALRSAVLLVVPKVEIARKTATLYGRITTDDLSPGTRIDRNARRLRAGLPVEHSDLYNAFVKPLYALVPSLVTVPDVLRECGCARFGLSGAGPTHFALLDGSEVDCVAARVRAALDPGAFDVLRASLVPNRRHLQNDC